MSCTGDCCIAFPVSCTPERLQEIPDLRDMLIPITRDEAINRRAQLSLGAPLPIPEDEPQMYRCTHWDENTRLCDNYDQRPEMCAGYPYGRSCDHGCSCRGHVHTPLIWEGDNS